MKTNHVPAICGMSVHTCISMADAMRFFINELNQLNSHCGLDLNSTYLTRAHASGHPFGARHDNDPNTSPIRFGHGFVRAC